MRGIHIFITWLRQEKGVVSVEMALIATSVFLLILPLTDFSTRLYNSMQLASAVRAAAQYAIAHPEDIAGIEAAAGNNAGSLDSEELTIETEGFCECGGTAYACENDCGYGMQSYLSISANYNQELLVSYPGYGDSTTITHTTTIRIE